MDSGALVFRKSRKAVIGIHREFGCECGSSEKEEVGLGGCNEKGWIDHNRQQHIQSRGRSDLEGESLDGHVEAVADMCVRAT